MPSTLFYTHKHAQANTFEKEASPYLKYTLILFHVIIHVLNSLFYKVKYETCHKHRHHGI